MARPRRCQTGRVERRETGAIGGEPTVWVGAARNTRPGGPCCARARERLPGQGTGQGSSVIPVTRATKRQRTRFVPAPVGASKAVGLAPDWRRRLPW